MISYGSFSGQVTIRVGSKYGSGILTYGSFSYGFRVDRSDFAKHYRLIAGDCLRCIPAMRLPCIRMARLLYLSVQYNLTYFIGMIEEIAWMDGISGAYQHAQTLDMIQLIITLNPSRLRRLTLSQQYHLASNNQYQH